MKVIAVIRNYSFREYGYLYGYGWRRINYFINDLAIAIIVNCVGKKLDSIGRGFIIIRVEGLGKDLCWGYYYWGNFIIVINTIEIVTRVVIRIWIVEVGNLVTRVDFGKYCGTNLTRTYFIIIIGDDWS